jgi:hypothetical protein
VARDGTRRALGRDVTGDGEISSPRCSPSRADKDDTGDTVPPVDFTVAARGGLDVWSEGAGTRSECFRHVHVHGCVGVEEECPGGPGWPQAELVK